MNLLLFFLQSSVIASASLVALKLGKEALVALASLLCILSNLFILKQITLCGLHVTAADSFTIGSILCIHLLQEYFGKEIAKKAIWICFLGLIFYTGISQIHLWYTPSIVDTQQLHFYALLRFAPRITLASLIVYFSVLQLDRYLYEKLKQNYGKIPTAWRNFSVLAVSQLIDTILFSFLGLYGIVNNITQIILFSYIVKMSATLITTPFMILSKQIKGGN